MNLIWPMDSSYIRRDDRFLDRAWRRECRSKASSVNRETFCDTSREIRTKQTRDRRRAGKKENLVGCFSRATRVEAKTAFDVISDCLRVRETQIRGGTKARRRLWGSAVGVIVPRKWGTAWADAAPDARPSACASTWSCPRCPGPVVRGGGEGQPAVRARARSDQAGRLEGKMACSPSVARGRRGARERRAVARTRNRILAFFCHNPRVARMS